MKDTEEARKLILADTPTNDHLPPELHLQAYNTLIRTRKL